ncbi:MAG: SEL1-like repeat protein [Selenomonas sp.]|nr:SEL1-like repeat protein [Selenomonas sp.]
MTGLAKLVVAGIAGASLWLGAGQAMVYAGAAVESVAAEQENVADNLPVTAVTKVYGDGEKVAAAVLEYPKAIAAGSVKPEDFAAMGKAIAAVHVSNRPDGAAVVESGRYVVLEFAYENTAYDGDLSKRQGRPQQDSKQQGNAMKGNKTKGNDAPMRSDRKLPDLALQVKQVNTLTAADGSLIAPSTGYMSSAVTVEPDIARFRQHEYTDPETGYSMPYNLYLPEDYTPEKKYPLLFFVADASANINEVTTPLFQGNGATVWATPEEQAKHECIVLAPQYTAALVEQLGMMTTDENKWTDGLNLVTHLLFDVMDKYSVDKSRIYGTGQSQGGMTNIAISNRYPELFAAQLLVACQWDVKEMEAMKDKNLWIVVCEGDTKAFPGMNEATARWEALGSQVARNEDFWDSKASLESIDAEVEKMAAQGRRINYSVFAGGNHMYTWSFAYNIEAIRDWLFQQRNSSVEVRGRHDSMNRGLLEAGIKHYREGNYEKALADFRAADSRGHMKAPRYLGLCYENGYGVKRDYKKAVAYYQKAAGRGDITGTCLLGHMYEEGLGVAKDYDRAMELYKKSAQRGDVVAAPGMVAVGRM